MGDGVELHKETIERYLTSLLGEQVFVISMEPLGGLSQETSLKNYGYGTPVRIGYQAAAGPLRSAVFHTMSPSPFGHEHMSDRAQILLWSHAAFNQLPRHVRSLDVGGLQANGDIISLGKVQELCLLTDYAEGQAYSEDLKRLRDTDELTQVDVARADALCDYLIAIHRAPVQNPGLYTRRIRELVGHGECIMGLADSYPPHPLISPELLEEIEHMSVKWRWKLKALPHRLRQVHGDFHPWNILFASGAEFQLLDRSRGEWGEPADDVASITANYLFFSLQRSGRLDGALGTLFLRFWERYLEGSRDQEMLNAIAPFFAFRGLVMASPVWYPNLPDTTRRKLLAFVLSVLEQEKFDPAQVNSYCGD